jgi:hypothetical protein
MSALPSSLPVVDGRGSIRRAIVRTSQRNNVNISGPKTGCSNCHNENDGDAMQSVTNPINMAHCYSVTVSDRGEEEDATVTD